MIPADILIGHVSFRSDTVAAVKEELERATRSRDTAIRKAYAGGATIADLVRASGLTRTMLYKITNKEDA